MADAWSLFRSIGNAFKAFPAYAARTNMEYALYRAYGPDWEDRMRQEKQDRDLTYELDKATLDNKRMDQVTKYWQSQEGEAKAVNEKLKTALATGGRTTGKYTPAMVGDPGTARYQDLGQLTAEEAERKRLSKQRWDRYMDVAGLEQKEQEAGAELARKRERDAGDLAIEREKMSPEYLAARYADRKDYDREAEAEARHTTTSAAPTVKESVTERVARKLALANQILLENPSLDHPRTLDKETGEESEFYTETGRPIPYKDWDTVPYQIQQEVEARLSGSRNVELGTTEDAATPEPEKTEQYRIPVGLRMKIDAGMELSPEEIEFLRSLRQ